MSQQDKTKFPFPNYVPENINSIVLIVTDDTIYNEATDKQIGTILKDQTDANNFITKLKGFLKEHGFQLEASGTRIQMTARLYKKDGKDFMTEEECRSYTTDSIQYFLDNFGKTAFGEKIEFPTITEWRKTVNDMK